MAASSSPSEILCSICWEDAFGDCPRTAATLQCKHTFHLDCIGSAFNFKGRMECPVCRAIEPGYWRQKTDDHDEDDYDDDDYYDDEYDYDYDDEEPDQEFEVEEDEERLVQETGLQSKEKIPASESSSSPQLQDTSNQDSLAHAPASQEDEQHYGCVCGLGLDPSPSRAFGNPSSPSFTELQVQFAALKSQMEDMIAYLMQQGHLPPNFFKPQTSSVPDQGSKHPIGVADHSPVNSKPDE